MIPSNISVLSIFDYSGDIKHSFISAGCSALSLDMYQNPENKTVDFVTDILNFDYKQFARSQFNFLYIALPCDVYSIASGGFHFSKGIPVTSKAISSINILIRLYQIVSYFDCRFIIENPAGGLINNNFFRQFFSLQVTRVCLASFGFPTQKKTDLFSSFPFLFLSNPVHRVNGKYQAHKLYNLSYRKKVKYPELFVSNLVSNIIKQL